MAVCKHNNGILRRRRIEYQCYQIDKCAAINSFPDTGWYDGKVSFICHDCERTFDYEKSKRSPEWLRKKVLSAIEFDSRGDVL